MQSQTADNILWSRHFAPTETEDSGTVSALSRIEWHEVSTPTPLHSVIEHAAVLEEATSERKSRLMIIAGRSRRLAVENHHIELKALIDQHGGIASEVKKTVGDIATAFIVARSKASIVVMQAANVHAE